MSAAKTFLDTNVLVYAFDISAGVKREKARKVLADLWGSGLGVVSTQVLQEFFVTVTRKLPRPMDPKAARDVVSDLLKWDTMVVEGDTILAAIDLHRDHGYSFWDSLIVASAQKADCRTLLSEDFSPGITIAGLTITNPFR